MRVDMRPGSTNASSSSSSSSDSATTARGGGSVDDTTRDDTDPGRTYRFSTASEPPVYEFGFGLVRKTLCYYI